MKTYIMFKQHKIRLHNIKQIEPQQKYRIGTISNIKLRGEGTSILQAPNLTLIFCSGSQH